MENCKRAQQYWNRMADEALAEYVVDAMDWANRRGVTGYIRDPNEKKLVPKPP